MRSSTLFSAGLIATFFSLIPAQVSAEPAQGPASNSAISEQMPLKHNPFVRPAKKIKAIATSNRPVATKSKGFKLRAILYDSTQPLADIDGSIVGLGDEHKGYQVTNISKSKVVLSKGGKRAELKLLDTQISGADQ